MNTTMLNVQAIEDNHTSGVYPKRPLTLVRGEGCYVWDDAGNRYFDMTSGQGVALLGHCHPAISAAINQQAQQLITCPEIFYNDQRAKLYEALMTILPEGLDRFFLCNSGAEAMEGALKAARLLTGRSGVVAMRRGFHGRTLGALALTWNKQYREEFAAWLSSDVTHIAYGDEDVLAEAITEETAAVVVESVQGEGGVHPASEAYLQAIRARCDAVGALLVVDEIQTGLGRTGRWFGFMHSDVVPDIVALGKGLASGVPMGAVVWRGELGGLPRGSHGSTFGGNPLACASAIATLRELQRMDAPSHASQVGNGLRQRIEEGNWTQVREVRGRGLMIGMTLRTRVTPILQALQERHILALPAGKNVLRLLPPLILTQEQAQSVLDILQEVLQ
jgi:acetylornithine/LysW-gamma-L-lysine aminotransferase